MTIQQLQSDYATLRQQLTGLESRVSALESVASRLVEPRDLQLLGGWRIPNTSIDGVGTATTGGSFDLRTVNGQRRVIMHHATQNGRIIEYALPLNFGVGAVSTWPLATVVEYTAPTFAEVKLASFRICFRGVLWDEATQSVWVSSRQTYQSSEDAAPDDWLIQMQAVNGSIANSQWIRHTPNMDHHWTGGGFAHIPPSLQPLFGGAAIAAARGGYDMLESSMGPSFAAMLSPVDHRVCVGFPSKSGREKSCRRDAAYYRVRHTASDNLADLFFDRAGNDGRWQPGHVRDGAFVVAPGLRGYVVFAELTRGTIDYRSQDTNGKPGRPPHKDWGKAFRIPVPSWMYSTATDPWNNHGDWPPSSQPEHADDCPGLRWPTMHVFDPTHMAQAFAGHRSTWDHTPTEHDVLPPAGGPSCCRYDEESGLLYVMLLDAHGSSGTNPALAVYRVQRNDAGSNPPFAMPSGWAYDHATGDMLRG